MFHTLPCTKGSLLVIVFIFQGIADIRIDRKALPNAVRRFWSILSRLPNMLVKGSWRSVDQTLTAASHAKLEALLSVRMQITCRVLKVKNCLLKYLTKSMQTF